MARERIRRPEPTSRRVDVPLGALVLIAVGVVLLLQTTDVLPWALWRDLWRFWPVILIAIGVNIALGSRAPWLAASLVLALVLGSFGTAVALSRAGDGGGPPGRLTEPLGDLSSVAVSIGFGAGDLTVRSLPAGSSELVDASFRGRDAKATLRRSGKSADLRIAMERPRPFRSSSNVRWEIALAQGPSLSLEIDGGAAEIALDLRELQVTDLELDAGASDVRVDVPARAGNVNLSVDAGAATVDINVPEGVAAKVHASSGASSLDIDTHRFPRSGDTWTSPGFEKADHRVTIRLRAGASRVRIR